MGIESSQQRAKEIKRRLAPAHAAFRPPVYGSKWRRSPIAYIAGPIRADLASFRKNGNYSAKYVATPSTNSLPKISFPVLLAHTVIFNKKADKRWITANGPKRSRFA